jgi:hypothetical protein
MPCTCCAARLFPRRASNAASVPLDAALAAKLALEPSSDAVQRMLAALEVGGAPTDMAAALAAAPGGFAGLARHGVLPAVAAALADAKNTPRRQAAVELIAALVASPETRPAEPWVIARLPVLLELLADKVDGVRKAAEAAVEAFTAEVSGYATPALLPILYEAMGNKK